MEIMFEIKFVVISLGKAQIMVKMPDGKEDFKTILPGETLKLYYSTPAPESSSGD